jgi:hypothetical protein
MKGRIINPKGEVSVSATGVFALFSPESIRKTGIIDAAQIEELTLIMSSHSRLK